MRTYRYKVLVALWTTALLFSGCSNKDPEVVEESFECRIAGALAPTWACGNSELEGYYSAVGSAPLSKIGHGFSRREALANGRSNLAQQIETLVKDKVETFARSTGIGAGEVADKVSTQVSKQVAKVTLQGSKQVKYWENPNNGDIYLLVSIAHEAVNSAAKDRVLSSYKNNSALWQQFQAKNALEALEQEFSEK